MIEIQYNGLDYEIDFYSNGEYITGWYFTELKTLWLLSSLPESGKDIPFDNIDAAKAYIRLRYPNITGMDHG